MPSVGEPEIKVVVASAADSDIKAVWLQKMSPV
jgi:hypothetical protein